MLSLTLFHAGAKKQGFVKALKQDGPYLFDADKVINSKHYVSINSYTGQFNSLAVLNNALNTVRILSYIIEPQDEALSEAAIEKNQTGNG